MANQPLLHNRVTKATEFGEITQNYLAMTQFKVIDFGTNQKPICDFLLVINSRLTNLLSCAVSKLWPIIGQIFASNRGMLHFKALLGVIPCKYPDKLYLFRN